MMYSVEEILKLRDRAKDCGMFAPAGFWCSRAERLCEVCNGVGSSAAPQWLRNKTTKFFRSIEAAAAIHDYMYAESDGSVRGKTAADAAFLQNGTMEIRRKYKWWNWCRYIAWAKLIFAFDALRAGGLRAWAICWRQKIKIKENYEKIS